MKRLILLPLLLFALLCKAQGEQGITFFKGSFNEALAEAKKQNKPLFVDFYATWCVPCKRMAKEVFTLPEVGEYFNSRFISLQIDAEKPENKEIAKQEDLLEAAKIVAGEGVSFEQLYEAYKKNPNDLEVQQQMLMKAPNFLAAQEGMEADKWVVRIQKLYKGYIAAKKGPKLINKDDYAIIYNLEGNDDKAHKQEMVDFINQNLDAWKAAIGTPAAYYVVMSNDAWAEELVKEGSDKYKQYVEKIKNEYAKAYEVAALPTLPAYERAKLYYDALYNLYKNKDVKGYIRDMKTLLQKMGDKVAPADYGKAAQDLYNAAGKKLTADDHKQAIEWVEQALKAEEAVMERVNYLVMIGDSYRELKNYAKARECYNQGYAESLRMQNMEMPQAMVQNAIKHKLATLELLEK